MSSEYSAFAIAFHAQLNNVISIALFVAGATKLCKVGLESYRSGASLGRLARIVGRFALSAGIVALSDLSYGRGYPILAFLAQWAGMTVYFHSIARM